MADQINPIQHIQDEIIEEFSQLPDWTDKYEYLIDMGKQLLPIDPTYKTDAYLVRGCQSRVWLHGSVDNGRLHLQADSDTVITKGIIALLIRVFSGQTLEDIQQSDIYYIEKIGLQSHLSPTRSNGLASMIRHIRSYAALGESHTDKPQPATKEDHREQLIATLKTIYDPEIPVDIWELGLIYTLEIDEAGKVTIVMTLTSPACPVAGSLPLEIQESIAALPFVTDVDLKLVWSPSWSKDLMSDEARMALDMF